jgi:hypothetical protein
MGFFRKAIFAIAAVGISPLWAQSNFGGISGRVTDSTGGAVIKAKILVRNEGTNLTVRLESNAQGEYTVSGLAPVTYEITAEFAGFQKTIVNAVKVDTSRVSTVDIVLRPGDVSTSVEITSDAPLLQTVQGALQQNVDQRTINDLPLNGRNTLELSLTLPGVAGSVGTEFSELTTNEPVPGRELSINGGRVGTTQFQADGANVTSIALGRMSVSFSPDTIQEFSVQQANYSAQYAQAGGAIIQQTTKSGTNDPHGTLFWFHRQRAFTANPFDAQRTAVTNFDNRPPLRRQQLGAVLTGPVWIPKIYNGKNKTFFMFSYEPTRQLASNPGGPTNIRVPTEREIGGDFSQTQVYFRNAATGAVRTEPSALLYNQFVRRQDGALALRPNPTYNPNLPASATNFVYQYRNFPLFNPNDPDPARRGRVLVDEFGRSLVNPAAQRIARELYPTPNITDPGLVADLLGANYSYFRQTRYVDDRFTIKLDHNITNANRLTFRLTEQPQSGTRQERDPVQHGLISDATTSRQMMMTLISAPRPSMTNELRLNYVYGNFQRGFPTELLGQDFTNEYLNTGGPGAGAVNLLGYGMPRFYDGGNFFGASGQASGANAGTLGFNSPQDVGLNKEHSYSLTDDFSWTQGARTWKFGFSASHLQLNQSGLGVGSLAGGRFFWARNQTAEQECATNPLGGAAPDCAAQVFGGDKFASFLLGVPQGVQVQTENLSVPYYYRWLNLGGYVQHDWRVRRNLTLNIGLRYQFQSPRWEKFNRQGSSNIDRLEPNPFVNNLPAPVFEYAGAGDRSRYITPAIKDVFEPRFGFAWTPFQNQNFVIRGGYGMTHGVLMGNDREPIPNLGAQTGTAFRQISYVLGANDLVSPTNVPSCGVARCDDPALPMQFGFNNPVLASDSTLFQVPSSGVIRPSDRAGSNSSGLARPNVLYQSTGVIGYRNFRMPTTHNYSFQLEKQIAANMVARVSYQGSRSTHQYAASPNLNRVDPFTGRLPYPGFSGRIGASLFVLNPTEANATYHAAVVEVERRFSQGLQFRANYTFSKNIDDSSGGISFPIPNNSFNNSGLDLGIVRNQNPYNRAADRSVSSTNTPHIFNLTGLWDLPFGRGRKLFNGGGWKDAFISGWNLNGLARLRSGLPVAVPLGIANSLDTGTPGGTLRPDMISGVPLRNPDWTRENAWRGTPYINPRAFAVPEPGQYGNAPRNLDFYWPSVKTFDSSVFKRFYLTESRRKFFELRAEVFNILNMKQYLPNSNVASNAQQILTGAAQNPLLVGTSPNQVPVQGTVENRYANLRVNGVWDAIIARSQGVNPDTAIANLPGPGAGGLGCPANATELGATNQTRALSPACVARALTLPTGGGAFGRLQANNVQPRIWQFALKFYF